MKPTGFISSPQKRRKLQNRRTCWPIAVVRLQDPGPGNQVIEHNTNRNRFILIHFFENNIENEPGRLVPDIFLLCKKALFETKQVVCSLVSVVLTKVRNELKQHKKI